MAKFSNFKWCGILNTSSSNYLVHSGKIKLQAEAGFCAKIHLVGQIPVPNHTASFKMPVDVSTRLGFRSIPLVMITS